MDWVLRSPQIHSTFGNLGYAHPDGYHINENCNAALETILRNILTEDKYLRNYRRSISFGQNINKDIIPLLLHAKEDKTIELLIKILELLTIPIECLLSVDVISKTDYGRHTVFEMNNLLTSSKSAFTDQRVTKVIIGFLKKNVEGEQKGCLSEEQCSNINNSLLLLRNILHIPEESTGFSPNYNNGSVHTVQNQILWNIFSQSIDKILIKLMTIPDATNWGVTMVQLVALLYKDQHAVTLHKLLNIWLEASLSESSEDNESNTSPPNRGSEDSSPLLTSDPTSDSSDTLGSGKSNDDLNSVNDKWTGSSETNTMVSSEIQDFQPPQNPEKENKPAEITELLNSADVVMQSDSENDRSSSDAGLQDMNPTRLPKSEKKSVISETSDCGYATLIETQEFNSPSRNEDKLPIIEKKSIHQKCHSPKQRVSKGRTSVTIQDRKRKKIVKRGKANIINVQGLSHKTPADDDISNILKEFTVDFLLKGYNSLVQTLHNQILSNPELEIDTSHFFWLVTYFLKFATQIEMGLEHVCSVLSSDIVSYLTAEGVNLCEQFELAIKLDGNDLKPSIRRLHLVVTAIREFVQAIEMYKKMYVCGDDQGVLVKLQIKICEMDELRLLLVLLLRHYNPKYHTKQYLQDLVVTNHILLIFLDSVMRLPDYKGNNFMVDHIKQFATADIMYQYGLLLEDYTSNGEFVNDCIFTMMHHVGGELDKLSTLFQPKILKTFTSIWKSEYEICDDWSDLVQYVINTFVKKPHLLKNSAIFHLVEEKLDDDKLVHNLIQEDKLKSSEPLLETEKKQVPVSTPSNISKDRWTEEELSSLTWIFMQCNSSGDMIGEIIEMFKEDGIIKTRASVLTELFRQNLINKVEFETLSKKISKNNSETVLPQVPKESGRDEIGKLCEQFVRDGKSSCLDWVQNVLLETCFAKIYHEKITKACLDSDVETALKNEIKIMNFEMFKKKEIDVPIPSPVYYHSLLYQQSVPLVPWNCAQASTCKDLKFLQLLHKLGFHMPVDTGKVFIRIPHYWTATQLFEIAGKIFPIDPSKLKFSVNDLFGSSCGNTSQSIITSLLFTEQDIPMIPAPEHLYQIQKQLHLAKMVNFTPMPGTLFTPKDAATDTHNWLDLIQKSEKHNLLSNFGSAILDDDEDRDSGMQSHSTDEEVPPLIVPPIMPGIVPPIIPGIVPPIIPGIVPPIIPGIVTPIITVIDVKTDSIFNVQIQDSEYCNNSVCETASVASDLTRMYVSDEEDKPEAVIKASVEDFDHHCMDPPDVPQDDLQFDAMKERTADNLSSKAKKRPRIHFASPPRHKIKTKLRTSSKGQREPAAGPAQA